ncbi:hypothetical protein S40285_02331 [Stachybotrys chlorohalonatus IBT 40285]|uniref:Zn(2)-C6 fungal-type domain-containing protein n=1 Tax=Stachybotrys chlorohalonatus (strain IBT 40285) TaxID=1283841 RepID=A0A084QSG8_STAC4|nr:hypothetical protein S40285_02331 [Stachybotrys chlorohalonata IBT 40285]
MKPPSQETYCSADKLTFVSARKVKCDEGRPHCNRCTSTSRTCGGYPPQSKQIFTWDDLLRRATIGVTPKLTDISEEECRSVDFYRHTAGPRMANWFDSSFWNHTVLQVSTSNPTAWHALVTLSAVCERRIRPGDTGGATENFIFQHYNLSLRKIASSSENGDINIALLACIIFFSIEALLGQKHAALNHIRHGMIMLYSSPGVSDWTWEYLAPIFLRLGCNDFLLHGMGPLLPSNHAQHQTTPTDHLFASIEESRRQLDIIFAQVARFVGRVNVTRPQTKRFTELHETQNQVLSQLDNWQLAHINRVLLSTLTEDDAGAQAILRVIFLVSKVWTKCILDLSEMSYDYYLDEFKEMVRLSVEILDEQSRTECTGKLIDGNEYLFEVEMLPLMCFMATKCRDFEIRMQALRAMERSVAAKQDNWELRRLCLLASSVIDREIAVDIGDPGNPDETGRRLPPSQARVRTPCIRDIGPPNA